MRATFSSTRRALLDGWSPYAHCVLHPAFYLSPQRCPPALESPPGLILQFRLLCVLREPEVSIRSHLLTSSVLRLFPYLLPCPLAEIRTQVALRLTLPAGLSLEPSLAPTMPTSQVRPSPGAHGVPWPCPVRLLLSQKDNKTCHFCMSLLSCPLGPRCPSLWTLAVREELEVSAAEPQNQSAF